MGSSDVTCKAFIPSYNRAGEITTLSLIPDATLVVRSTQEAEYRRCYPDSEIWACPDEEIDSLAKVRQYINALYKCDEEVNDKKRGDDRTRIFIAKAIVLLLHAKKNRDSDYLACNMMDTEELIAEADLVEFDQPREDVHPDWVYDVHTAEGKRMGKTKESFFEEEMMALKNGVVGLFDSLV